jgi:hypothetical protein
MELTVHIQEVATYCLGFAFVDQLPGVHAARFVDSGFYFC